MGGMLATACGFAAMMTSVPVSPGGVYEYEAARTVESVTVPADLEKVTVIPSHHTVKGLQFMDIVQKRLMKRLGM